MELSEPEIADRSTIPGMKLARNAGRTGKSLQKKRRKQEKESFIYETAENS